MCKALADMIEDGRIEGRIEGREEGRIEGREEGRIKGRTEGEDLFAVLVKNLLRDSRTEELMLAVNDKEVRKVLYAEYHININE